MNLMNILTCDGVRQVSGLRREPVVSVKILSLIPHPTETDDPDPVVADTDPLVESSVHRTPAQ